MTPSVRCSVMLAPDDPLFPGDARPAPEAMLLHWGGRLGHHTGPLEFWRHFGMGDRARGLLRIPDPEWLEPVLDQWLGGPSPARTPLAYTGLGDILYFRDLSERARQLGLDEATIQSACDISLLSTRWKRVEVLAHSMEAFLSMTADPAFSIDVLDAELYFAGVERVGEPGPAQILGFVPALGLGGAEDAGHLEPAGALAHWEILFQL